MPPIRGASGRRTATLDYWDDPTDVWALRLAAGERLLSPSTETLFGAAAQANHVLRSSVAGPRQRISHRVPKGKGGRLARTRQRPSARLSACSVFGPKTPSAVRPWARWKAATACLVAGPYWASTAPAE